MTEHAVECRASALTGGGCATTRVARRLLALIALASVAPVASAEEFSWQLTGGIQRTDSSQNIETNTRALAATYFFGAVDDANGPLEVAPFLSRSSSITAAFQAIERTQVLSYISPIGGLPVLAQAADEHDAYAVSGRHVWRTAGWYVGGGIESYDLNEPDTSLFAVDAERDAYALLGGKYLGPSTALELNLRSTQSSTEMVPLPCSNIPLCPILPGALGFETVTEDVDVSILHVGGRGGLRYAVSGHALTSEATIEIRTPPIVTSQVPPATAPAGIVVGGFGTLGNAPISLGTVRLYSVAGELFPTSRLGVRLGYTAFDGNTPLDRRYEIAATWFFNRAVAAEVAVARTRQAYGPQIAIDEDSSLIRLIGRF